MKLKEIVNVKRGLVARAEQSGDIRYLRLADFDESGQIQSGHERFLAEPCDDQFVLKTGDILMSIVGPRFFALQFPEAEGTFVPNHFFNILHMKSDRYTAEQIVEYLNSEKVQEELDGLTDGETIRSVPTKSLKDLQVRI